MSRRFCCVGVLGWCRCGVAFAAFGCRVASFRSCVWWTKGDDFRNRAARFFGISLCFAFDWGYFQPKFYNW